MTQKKKSIDKQAPAELETKSNVQSKVAENHEKNKTSSAKANVNNKSRGDSATGFRVSPIAFTIVCLIALTAVGVYVWQELRAVQQQQHQNQIQALKNKEELLSRLTQSNNDFRREQASLKIQSQELKQSIIELKKLAGRGRQGWILAEVEYLLLVANHKIRLQSDSKTAMTALREADARLVNLADPQLLTARKLIAEELAKLRAVVLPDINGITLKLDALSSQIKELSLISATPGSLRKKANKVKREQTTTKLSSKEVPKLAMGEKSVKDEKSFDQTVKNIWAELKTLVVVRRRDKPILPMLLPEQDKALRQVLEFKIQAARVAVFKQQQHRFKSSLSIAVLWIDEHFDANDQEVKKFKQSIAKLQLEKLKPTFPDITGSLQEVQFHLNKSAGIKAKSSASNIDEVNESNLKAKKSSEKDVSGNSNENIKTSSSL